MSLTETIETVFQGVLFVMFHCVCLGCLCFKTSWLYDRIGY